MAELDIVRFTPLYSLIQVDGTQLTKTFRNLTPAVFTELHLHDFLAKHCPSVVPVLRSGVWQGVAVLGLQLCPQGSLADFLSLKPALHSEFEVFSLCMQMIEAVGEVHQLRVAIGNIDLSNWLLRPEGGVYLTDFGSAVLVETGHSLAVARQLHFPASPFELDLKALGKTCLELVARRRLPDFCSLSTEEKSALVARKCSEAGYSPHLTDLITYLLHRCTVASSAIDLFSLEKTLPNSPPTYHRTADTYDLTDPTPVSQPCALCQRVVEADFSLLTCEHRLCPVCLHGAVSKQGILCPKCRRVTKLEEVEGRAGLSEKVRMYAVRLLSSCRAC